MPRSRRRRSRSRKPWWTLPLALIALSIFQVVEAGRITWHLSLRDAGQDWVREVRAALGDDTGADSPARRPQTLTGRVTRVTDGDTFHLRDGAENSYIVRLYGIDAPESAQPYGDQARRALTRAVMGRTVTLTVRDVDRYERLVAEVEYAGEQVNRSLVQNGWAWWYEDFARQDAALRQAQSTARQEGVGLWAEPDPEPPWEWRRRN